VLSSTEIFRMNANQKKKKLIIYINDTHEKQPPTFTFVQSLAIIVDFSCLLSVSRFVQRKLVISYD
jgi:hypothetical protein